MHTLELKLELDDYSFQNLVENAKKEGKSPVQWVQEMIARFSPNQNIQNDVVYRNYKGEPITAENQNFPDLTEFHKKFPKKKYDEGFLLSDDFLESFENIEKPRSLLELIGKGKGCFKSTAEIDSFIREERDAWEK